MSLAQDRSGPVPAPPGGTPAWKLEDAKARFSEVVRLALQGQPQHVSVRGRPAVVVLSAEEYARLAPAASSPSLAALFADSPFARLNDFEASLVRERAPMREARDFEA
ncbi:MAG TPA: type II toxin-antitoxin system Phd/YefM family antitoxin [Acetobacteraceae bacterium]|nr:type II toxin-antitoxin system Phd/YefM family antitoxin [Acetobacteraceae bacterium]